MSAAAQRRTWGDRIFRLLCRLAGVTVLSLALLLVIVLAVQAWPAVTRLGETQMLTSAIWDPDRGTYGALGFVYGTAVTSLIAMVLAVPLGVGSALYLSEIASRRVRQTCAFLLELLAAIPSVVYGFWAKAFLAQAVVLPLMLALGIPGVEVGLGGQSLLSAGAVLAIMVLPFITAISFDVLRSVPRAQREAALALGATRWQMLGSVVLPAARAGILAGAFLALGRALGETMAVTMVVGNSDLFRWSPGAPGDTIPSIIAKVLHETSPGGSERSVLVALGFLLLTISLGSNWLARAAIGWLSRGRAVSFGRPAAPPPLAEASEVPEEVCFARARRRARRIDQIMHAVLLICQIVTVVPLFLILGFVAWRGAGEVNWAFFTQLPPPFDHPGGLGHAVLGSLLLVALAAGWSVPLSLMTAIFLSEFPRSRLSAVVRFVAETLSSVPSVIIGIYAYALLVYPIWRPDLRWGFSAWAGAFALGVMMLPVTIRSAEEALKLVPSGLREASYALGATHWQTLLKVLVPAAFPAILTGILLAIGRVAGETAPLLLTSRGSNFWPRSLAEPTPSVPFFINEFSKQIGQPEYERLGWAAAFLLLMAVLFLNLTTRLLAGKRVSPV